MTRRLRIVTVCRSFPTPDDPSAGVFVLNRVAAMAQRADVTVLHAIPHFPFMRPLSGWAKSTARMEAGLEIENVPMFYLPGMLKSLDSSWLARSVAGRIGQLHRQRPIDLIDAHFGYPEGVGCETIARRLNIPLFITIRGFEKEFVDRPIIGSRMLAAMSRATGIVSVSHSLRQFAIDRGIRGDKIQVVHNAIDSRRFCYGDPRTARAGLGLTTDGPLVVSVGHLIPRKRHNVLIETFSALRRSYPGARLAIIGSMAADPSHARSLSAQVHQLGLDQCVTLLGNRPPAEVVNWLRAADVFVLATAREGCCNAILEALAVGVPVVTTPTGDNAKFVKADENGALAPIDDVRALAMAIDRTLVRMDWNRPGIAAALHAQVGDWQEVAVRVLDFFDASLQAR